jgi:hypothetical protein
VRYPETQRTKKLKTTAQLRSYVTTFMTNLLEKPFAAGFNKEIRQ